MAALSWKPLSTRSDLFDRRDRRGRIQSQRDLRGHRRGLPARQHFLWRRRVQATDGGQTWTNVGLKDTRHIGAVMVDPRNPDIVLVAALGHAYGPNAERGVFRTTDGGKTWEKVLYKDDNTGAIDVAFDPHNSNMVFAALWQIRRTPWSFNSGGPGSGLYRSTDGGNTWKQLEGNGLPEGVLGRIGVSVSGADSNRVYALDRGQGGRPLSLRRWRRNLDARQRRRALPAARLVLHPHLCRPQGSGHGLRAEHRRVPLDRRRQDLQAAAGAAWRSSRAVDRSHESEAHDQRQRWRRHDLRGRRQDLDARRTTSRRRSSITSPPTTTFPTTCTARSRTTAPSASPAGATMA